MVLFCLSKIAFKIPIPFADASNQGPVLRIAVNTRLLLENKLEGMGWFSYESLKRITRQHPEHEFIFIFDRPYSDQFIFADNVTPVVVGPKTRHPFLFWLWFELSVKRVLRKYKADLFLSPDGFLSLGTKTPSLAVIHDLNFEHHQENLPWLVRKYYRHYFPKFARKAKRIATVSIFSKLDIEIQYGIKKDNIDVVYNGVNEHFAPLSEDMVLQVRNNWTEGNPYFLFIGALNPRKNLVRMFKAYDQFRKENDSNVRMVIVGKQMYWTDAMRDAYEQMEFKRDVVFTGHISTEELFEVTGAALALTYVSYFEGFGIPVVEAMKSGVPVITSNVTSMPEIAGEAAILVDPFKVEEIKDAMAKVAGKPSVRKELIRLGTTRAAMFTWQNTADALWNSIEKTMQNGKA